MRKQRWETLWNICSLDGQMLQAVNKYTLAVFPMVLSVCAIHLAINHGIEYCVTSQYYWIRFLLISYMDV